MWTKGIQAMSDMAVVLIWSYEQFLHDLIHTYNSTPRWGALFISKSTVVLAKKACYFLNKKGSHQKKIL